MREYQESYPMRATRVVLHSEGKAPCIRGAGLPVRGFTRRTWRSWLRRVGFRVPQETAEPGSACAQQGQAGAVLPGSLGFWLHAQECCTVFCIRNHLAERAVEQLGFVVSLKGAAAAGGRARVSRSRALSVLVELVCLLELRAHCGPVPGRSTSL
jgi:hypothetical protein